MAKNNKMPAIRFSGYTDAWEQRKADYIFKSITDKGYPELPVLSASQELGMVYRDQNGIDIQHDKKNETSYKRVLPGQFVIHLRSFQGGFAYSEVEGITSPAYTVMSFKNSSEQYGLFWKHVFKSETFIKRLETITYGIRDGRSISFSDFKSLILQYPSFSEQKLIGDSIAVLEKGITLHQRKLEKLKLTKKALLQKLFPKNGSNIPELRFKGFTNAWEQRKLKSIANTIVAGGDIDKTKIKEIGTYPVIANALTKEGIVGYYNDDYRIEAPAVTVTGRGDIGVAKARHQNFTPVVRLLSLTTAHDVDFIENAINNLKIVSESTGVPQLTVPQLSNYKIYITSIIEEQKIGVFISKLDNLITLHQRKLEMLKNVKKGLLQKMFV